MAGPNMGWGLRVCVTLLRPPLMALTRRDWHGGDKLPRSGGGVIVANHISHADPLVYAHFVYDSGRLPRFLAKAEILEVKGLKWLLSSAGQIPVYRESRDASVAFRAAVAAVERGECVIVYPEGTITRDPRMWPMVGKTGAARIALKAGVQVIPSAQWGAQDILAPYAKKPRLLPRKTIRVRAGDPVDLDDLRSGPITPEVLREATDRIMTSITALLEEIRGESAPAVRFDPRVHKVPATGNPNRAKRARRRRGS
ncbi:MAG TPA: lysophospholipid acyltransferase family protein [Nocardioidaceae bacterium]|nr:lysophospholipid acyltransferase family protein [Nocardioidaceae bacterium]